MTSLLGRLRLLKRQWDTHTHTRTLTYTRTPVCSMNTEIICVIKKLSAVSSLSLCRSLTCLTPVRRQRTTRTTWNMATDFFSFVFYFLTFRRLTWITFPSFHHAIHLARFLLLQAYRFAYAHAHILSSTGHLHRSRCLLCSSVCGLGYDLKDIGYSIGVRIISSS